MDYTLYTVKIEESRAMLRFFLSLGQFGFGKYFCLAHRLEVNEKKRHDNILQTLLFFGNSTSLRIRR